MARIVVSLAVAAVIVAGCTREDDLTQQARQHAKAALTKRGIERISDAKTYQDDLGNTILAATGESDGGTHDVIVTFHVSGDNWELRETMIDGKQVKYQ